jgi:hypothetical protein
MSNLLEIHEQMLKEAETKQLMEDRVSILEKYAAYAEQLLQKDYPNNFNKSDVVELADKMIQHDIEVEEQQAKEAELQEKVAEVDALGRVMARSYWDELQKLNVEQSGK